MTVVRVTWRHPLRYLTRVRSGPGWPGISRPVIGRAQRALVR